LWRATTGFDAGGGTLFYFDGEMVILQCIWTCTPNLWEQHEHPCCLYRFDGKWQGNALFWRYPSKPEWIELARVQQGQFAGEWGRYERITPDDLTPELRCALSKQRFCSTGLLSLLR
jgi:hypothetical protein